MEQKSSNTLAIAIIALATVLIVAMICGMLMWMVDRNQSFNERLLDRQMQATARTAEPAPTPAPAPVQVATPAQPVTQTPAPAPQPAPEVTAPATPTKTTAAPAKKPATTRQKPATKPTTSVPAKRVAPKETEAAQTRVGPDGQPEHRITLPVGNDDLDWQLQ